MKDKDYRKILSVIFILLLTITSSAFTQSTDEAYKKRLNDSKLNPDGTYGSNKYDESQRPEDSYLAKFHAIEVVEKLMRVNLDQIYLLKVIVSNYKGKGWDADYKKAYEGYRLGMELFYRRNVIYSRLEFENNKKTIDDLLKKISDEYKKETESMLFICAAKILELHLDEKTRSDPNKTEELFKNQMRLRISYGQFDDGLHSSISHNYVSSILHYRVAKTYAIKILEDLSRPEEIDSTKEKYKIHKADNLNRIYQKASGGGGRTAPKGTGTK